MNSRNSIFDSGEHRAFHSGRVREICMAVPAVLLMTTIFAGAGCEEKMKPPVSHFDMSGELPDQESWKTEIVFSDSGSVRAIVHAGHILMYEQRRATLIDSGVVVDFYDNDGKHSSRLTSRRGRVNDATKDLEAFDQVVFISDENTRVDTEYLFWDNAKKKVRSDKFVTVVSPKEHLQGYGFEADQNLKNYVIFRVSGETEVEKSAR